MNKWPHTVRVSAVALIIIAASTQASKAVPNNWTNSASSPWQISTNWSLAIAPNNSAGVDPTQITNAGIKTVTINAATSSATLLLGSFTLSAPTDSANTLALVNVPLATPLTTSGAFLVSNRGALAITNSAVNATGNFDIVGGSLILDSGSLTCRTNCDLQSGTMLINSGSLNAIAGTNGIQMGRFAGATTSLTVKGGAVNALRLAMGYILGSTSTLTIAGGAVNLLSDFSAGQRQSTTADVTISSGSLTATNGFAKIADRSTATFTQTGGAVSFGDLSLGNQGVGTYNFTGGTFRMIPFSLDNLFIVANLENADFNQRGGVAVIGTEIHIADSDVVTGNINITGGQFFATNDIVAIGRQGIGAMLVTNANVVLTNTSVGRHFGSSGTLTVQNNANVSLIGDLSIGRFAGASGTVQVQGGTLSVTSDDLWVGRAGSGDLSITGGTLIGRRVRVACSEDGTNAPSGTFSVSSGNFICSSNLIVGTPLVSSGQLNLSGGRVIVTNSTGSASVQISSGIATMDGGTLTTDKLLINNSNATFSFNNGLIRAKTITVSNSQPFTVGDGINPATLELLGGTYTFADGLVISPNATVTGCGTVIGTVVNNGTYNNPCGSIAAIRVSNITKIGNSVTIQFNTLSGSNHIVEYKTNLAAPTWNSLLPAIPGNGSTMSKTDTTATNASRFYRVRVQ